MLFEFTLPLRYEKNFLPNKKSSRKKQGRIPFFLIFNFGYRNTRLESVPSFVSIYKKVLAMALSKVKLSIVIVHFNSFGVCPRKELYKNI
ncbi:hypothetical protein LEP1GSC133_1057 [Leptospira borgpetersenii serovar Pomona str. 200901868]|uniref:Uncharacterized protein n=1 Tax=Leptospira borgpetersenii serovar Pomona str. 200901868 TaxID=1192866 RepID=M6WQQ5_LEPBO|nr:hypothetical protein LEP1GSC133_1057 [Leptospira borgpetersenii serovar Pomona str. 200901868]